MPGSRRQLAALAAVTALALLARLPTLGQASLYLDEMWSIATAWMPWRGILSVVLHQDSNASLYYALLHEWLRLGEGEATVRLLSVLLGVATVPALYLLGARLAGPRVGLFAALLLAVNGFHIQFSQTARGYSLLMLLATLSTLCLVRAVEAPDVGRWVAYAITSALAVYAHLFAALLIPAHAVALLLLRRRAHWRGFLGSAALAGALVLPVGALLLVRSGEPNAPLAWLTAPTLRRVGGFFWLLAGNTTFSSGPGLAELARGFPLLFGYLALCLLAVHGGWRLRRDPARRLEAWAPALLLSLVVVPLALVIAASLRKPLFVHRFLLVCLPPLVLLAALGAGSLRRRWARGAALGALVALAMAGLPGYFRSRAAEVEWRAATAYLLDRARPGDAVLFFVAPGRLLFDYYRDAAGRTSGHLQVIYPEPLDDRRDPKALAYLPPLREDLVASAAARHDRVWLVLYHDEFDFTAPRRRELEEALGARYRESGRAEFEGFFERAAVTLYARDPGEVTKAAGR
ncbi:MAG TPA: glycosyltransferase family 39 protein [Anaeromyxobacteraceae bacterium]|jgi:mannosyltransferase|nr:glycosyltransferase family 39 protein [Anaeromyxobacteraceae bacterium]